jgi:hypothetical protein
MPGCAEPLVITLWASAGAGPPTSIAASADATSRFVIECRFMATSLLQECSDRRPRDALTVNTPGTREHGEPSGSDRRGGRHASVGP